jgi:hypothetical protein
MAMITIATMIAKTIPAAILDTVLGGSISTS